MKETSDFLSLHLKPSMKFPTFISTFVNRLTMCTELKLFGDMATQQSLLEEQTQSDLMHHTLKIFTMLDGIVSLARSLQLFLQEVFIKCPNELIPADNSLFSSTLKTNILSHENLSLNL